MSICTTQGITISVEAKYLPDQSEPDEDKHFFAYEVTIDNQSTEAAQLVSRHWIIKDGHQDIEEVRGEGVGGQTPYLEPGQSYSYTSWCPLKAEFGSMRGSYQMQRPDGAIFDAHIAPFVLMPQHLLN